MAQPCFYIGVLTQAFLPCSFQKVLIGSKLRNVNFTAQESDVLDQAFANRPYGYSRQKSPSTQSCFLNRTYDPKPLEAMLTVFSVAEAKG